MHEKMKLFCGWLSLEKWTESPWAILQLILSAVPTTEGCPSKVIPDLKV